MTKSQVVAKLDAIGACFAVRSDKYVCADRCCQHIDGTYKRPAYHVHPDRSYPHVNSIMRFDSLVDIAAYCDARQVAETLPMDKGFDYMEDFYASQAA